MADILTDVINSDEITVQFWQCSDGHKFYCDLEDNEPECCPVCDNNDITHGDCGVVVDLERFTTLRHYKADTKEWMDRAERITTMGIELQQENARLREENEHCTKLLKHAIKINENNLCSFCCQALATETDGDKS